MGRLLGEANDLVLDRGAVSRPLAGDLTAIHGGRAEIGANDVVGLLVRVRDPATDLGQGNPLGGVGEEIGVLVPWLILKSLPVDRISKQSGRRSGLQPSNWEIERTQAFGKLHRRRLTNPTAVLSLMSDMDPAIQEGSGCQHNAR